jgi:lipoprotein-anchoring transpeptidase ErfK/SrfK
MISARFSLLAAALFSGNVISRAQESAAPPARTMGTLAMQAALDRAGFSPGLVDGIAGPKTRAALLEFQKSKRLKVSGEFDDPTVAALASSEPTTVEYKITPADARDIGEVPDDWNARAKLDRLRYESLHALVAERGHCTLVCVAWLNPSVQLERLRAGDTVTLPNVKPTALAASAAELVVDLEAKQVRALDAGGRTLLLLPCSIAANYENRPGSDTRVAKLAFDPDYTFRPESWPEVKNVTRTLVIPPGPRNPVGLCWIGLELPGYGIHGTPKPELIGKTGSHGCIRLANWDAVRLGKAVTIGMPVRFRR